MDNSWVVCAVFLSLSDNSWFRDGFIDKVWLFVLSFFISLNAWPSLAAVAMVICVSDLVPRPPSVFLLFIDSFKQCRATVGIFLSPSVSDIWPLRFSPVDQYIYLFGKTFASLSWFVETIADFIFSLLQLSFSYVSTLPWLSINSHFCWHVP